MDYVDSYIKAVKYNRSEEEIRPFIEQLQKEAAVNGKIEHSTTQGVFADFLEEADDGRYHVVRGDLERQKSKFHQQNHPRAKTSSSQGGSELQFTNPEDNSIYEIAKTKDNKLVGSWWPAYKNMGSIFNSKFHHMSSFLTPEQAHHFIDSLPFQERHLPLKQRMHDFIDGK